MVSVLSAHSSGQSGSMQIHRQPSTLPALRLTDHRPILARDNARELMPRVCTRVEVDGPVRDGTELSVSPPGRERDADACRPSRPGLTDRRHKVGVARHHENAITCAGGGQFHESHGDSDIGLLLFPAVPNASAVRAAHLPSLELTEDGLDTRSPVSYTHLRAHETDSYLVCRLLLEK